jgi:hypothetical protein
MTMGKNKAVAPHVGIPIGDHVEEFLVKPQFDQDGVQVSSGIGTDGREYPDPVPMSPPVGYEPPSDVLQMLEQLFLRGKAVLEAAQIETEEEANDFDIEDDPVDPLTPYEAVFNPPAKEVGPAANGPAANSGEVVAASPASSSSNVTPAAGGSSQKETPPADVK